MLLVCPHPNLVAAAAAAPVVVPPQEENPLEVALAAERAVAAQVVKVVEVPVARVAALEEKEDLVVAKAVQVVVEVLAVVARQELVVKAVVAKVVRAAALGAKAMQKRIARKLEKRTLHRSKVSSKR